jgi:ribose 5-phosphate isomerase B
VKKVIAIGSDHRGYNYKEQIKNYLLSNNYEVKDFGTDSAESVDYPDYAKKVADSIVSGESEIGVLICGTGIGVSIAANKIKGIRAANVTSEKMAEMSREHNNANIICFGGDIMDIDTVIKCLGIFLKTEFGGGRHIQRVAKIKMLET